MGPACLVFLKTPLKIHSTTSTAAASVPRRGKSGIYGGLFSIIDQWSRFFSGHDAGNGSGITYPSSVMSWASVARMRLMSHWSWAASLSTTRTTTATKAGTTVASIGRLWTWQPSWRGWWPWWSSGEYRPPIYGYWPGNHLLGGFLFAIEPQWW